MPSPQATYVLYFLLTAESFLVYKIMLTKERKDAEAKQVQEDLAVVLVTRRGYTNPSSG